jgi:hypothetical protein
MNERIRELAEQANYLATEKEFPYDEDWFYLYNKKFAELIVAGAIGVLQKRFMGDLNREDMEVLRCIDDLKKHFGVEE